MAALRLTPSEKSNCQGQAMKAEVIWTNWSKRGNRSNMPAAANTQPIKVGVNRGFFSETGWVLLTELFYYNEGGPR